MSHPRFRYLIALAAILATVVTSPGSAQEVAPPDTVPTAQPQPERPADVAPADPPVVQPPAVPDAPAPPSEVPMDTPGSDLILDGPQMIAIGAVAALYGISPLALSGTQKDVDYGEAFAITAAGSFGVAAFGFGALMGYVGYVIMGMAGDIMDTANDIPILGPIIMMPVALIIGMVGVGSMAGGAVLVLASPALTGFAMTRMDNAFNRDVDNPWTVSVTAVSGTLIGFAGGVALGDMWELDLATSMLVGMGLSLVTTTAGYAAFRDVRGERQTTMVASPLLTF